MCAKCNCQITLSERINMGGWAGFLSRQSCETTPLGYLFKLLFYVTLLYSGWIFHTHVSLRRGNFTLNLLAVSENEFIYGTFLCSWQASETSRVIFVTRLARINKLSNTSSLILSKNTSRVAYVLPIVVPVCSKPYCSLRNPQIIICICLFVIIC